jgi:hypothetical protein
VIEGWKKLYNEELDNLYSSSDIEVIISKMKWAGHVARIRRRNACSIFIGEAESN